jgi:methyl halide transferase
MTGPTSAFWQERFDKQQTPWDRGAASPQLLAWLDQRVLTPCRILVPGCGSGWEVAELARRGFDVTGLDYTPAAVARTRELLRSQQLAGDVLQADVLQFEPDQPFDAVYEQTCLCALHPDHWVVYARRLHQWLLPGATLWSMFMQMPRPAATQEGRIEGPPYHCDINAMRALFAEPDWQWPRPPYGQVPHPGLSHELAVPLTRH